MVLMSLLLLIHVHKNLQNERQQLGIKWQRQYCMTSALDGTGDSIVWENMVIHDSELNMFGNIELGM